MGTDNSIHNSVDETKKDYREPIARKGEQQFACILRNRSGFSAGEIDFGLRDLRHLSECEQQDVCDIAYALYQAICGQLHKSATNDERREEKDGALSK